MITDELRKWAECGTLRAGMSLQTARDQVLAIADRIDAEHQKALDEWNAKHGQMWLKGYAECHAELLEGNETLASDLESCGWIHLPKDADGEVIHVGDMVTEHEDGHTFTVDGFMAWDDEWWVFQRDAIQAPAGRCTHYKPPTVEDVLQELVVDWDCAPDGEDKAAVLKEYAARLQLRGEDE